MKANVRRASREIKEKQKENYKVIYLYLAKFLLNI